MKRLLFYILSLFAITSYAQKAPESGIPKGQVRGVIIDENSGAPIEYANVAIYSSELDELVTGGITNMQGEFTIEALKPGRYYAKVKFIGFRERQVDNFQINRQNIDLDLGKILLEPSVESLQGVEIVADKKAVSYKIDKKIVNPSQFMSAVSGTAVDVLANTPSVTVDVEGNVSLRGSSNFTVLIDGRPSPFTASDALEQVPAAQIETIEIITNPSAKYDPDGTSGIINIITKKNSQQGINGIVNVNASSIGSYSGDFLLNYRKNKFNFFVGANRSDGVRQGSYNGTTESYKGDTTYYTLQEGNGEKGRNTNSLKTGFNYSFSDNFVAGINLNAGYKQRYDLNTLDYTEGSTFGQDFKTKSVAENISDGNFFSGDINFEKKFKGEGHQLIGMFFYELSNSEEAAVNDRTMDDGSFLDGQKSWETDDSREYRLKLDYTLPISETIKLESGYQWRGDLEDSWTDQLFYTEPNSAGADKNSPNYYESTFNRNIHSAYSTLASELGSFGYQIGLRAEYTDRQINYVKDLEPIDSKIERLDFFPTLHLSYKLGETNQMMASYSKRIERPRGHYLEPFETWTDSYSVRSGNPDLLPEYINSYELSYQKELKKGFFSLEAFYRTTENKIDRVQSLWVDPATGEVSNTISRMTVANTGSDYALGIEGMVNLKLKDWWSLNINGSTFNYRVEGDESAGYGSAESQNWNTRISNTFNLSKTSRVQFDYMYNSASISAQGERGAFAFSNLSFRQEFMQRKLSATVSVMDVFNTAKFDYIAKGDGFKTERHWDMTSPIVQLQLSYKINNFTAKKERGGEGEGMDMDGF